MTHAERHAFHKKVADYVGRHPEMTYQQMSDALDLPLPTINAIAIKFGIRRGIGAEPYKATPELLAKLEG
ncbi:MAG: hypothetical protein ABSF92_00240 [Candidatus Acidiferrales bacterium]|jgi:hypothetical protein